MGARWSQSLREEFTIQKLHLSLSKPELLLQPQWDIPLWSWLLYRFSMLLYTLSWCVYTGLLFNTPKWFIFLSHLSYCLMGLYYLAAFCNLVAALTVIRYHCQKEQQIGNSGSLGTFLLPGCLSFSLRLQWFLHVVQGSLSLTVSILYWTVNYPVSRHPLSAFSINLHAVNSLQTLMDLVVSATPVHLCHYPYLLLTGSLYMLFVLLYWLTGSTNIGGQPYIYSVLDFGERPLAAVLCMLGFSLVCLPLFHFILWNVVLLRDRLARGPKGRRLALHRDTWWWGAVGGGGEHHPGSCLDPDHSVFGGSYEESRRDEQLSPLPMVTCSYQTVAASV